MLNKLTSLSWLSSKQSNASKRISEVQTKINNKTELMLGIASNSYGEHDLGMRLWAKDDKKLRYFSLKQDLSDSGFYFLGHGVSPSLFFGENKINSSFKNSLGRSSHFGSPFLDFASEGAFIGGGFKLRR